MIDLDEAGQRGFWFERMFRGLKLPFWSGAALLAFAPPLIQFFDSYAPAGRGNNPGFLVQFGLWYFAVSVYMLFAAALVGRLGEKAMDRAEAMDSGPTIGMRSRLYSSGWALVVFFLLQTLIFNGYVQSLGHFPSMTELLHDNLVPIAFIVLFFSYALWAFAYSMKSLYNLGRRTLMLKPFEVDRTLGLKPFGSAALRLTAAYEVGVIITAIPAIYSGNFSLTTNSLSVNWIVPYILFALLGFALFFLPLLSFRGMLKEARKREMAWIGPRYAELVGALKADKNMYVDERIERSLNALDKIQRDVQQIHTWPFDVGIITRLASITILPMLVTVLAREVIILILHV